MKKRTCAYLPGNYMKWDAEQIAAVCEGKTYMDFHVEYGGIAGNCTVIVSTENPDCESPQELLEHFYHFALTELARFNRDLNQENLKVTRNGGN